MSKKKSEKKTIYVMLAMFLGLLLSVMFYCALGISYLNIVAYNIVYDIRDPYEIALAFVFSPIFVIFLAVAGIGGGYYLGNFWWHLVYEEKRHWSFRSSKAAKFRIWIDKKIWP